MSTMPDWARARHCMKAGPRSSPAMLVRIRFGVRQMAGSCSLVAFHGGWRPSDLLLTPYRPRSRSDSENLSFTVVGPMKVPSVPSRTSHADDGEEENLLKRGRGSLDHGDEKRECAGEALSTGIGEPFIVTGMVAHEEGCAVAPAGPSRERTPSQQTSGAFDVWRTCTNLPFFFHNRFFPGVVPPYLGAGLNIEHEHRTLTVQRDIGGEGGAGSWWCAWRP